MNRFFLSADDAVLVIVDIQERLVSAMPAKETVMMNTLHLIELAKLLTLPVLLSEQYPKGLGRTIPEIQEALSACQPIEKMAFSCGQEPRFLTALEGLKRRTILLTGMETHVCVLQTALDLMHAGYTVHLVRDAVCSRSEQNWQAGLEFMRDAGAVITCTETVLFQLLKVAGTDAFKAISRRIK
jgi:nicotinamidase-related amidase